MFEQLTGFVGYSPQNYQSGMAASVLTLGEIYFAFVNYCHSPDCSQVPTHVATVLIYLEHHLYRQQTDMQAMGLNSCWFDRHLSWLDGQGWQHSVYYCCGRCYISCMQQLGDEDYDTWRDEELAFQWQGLVYWETCWDLYACWESWVDFQAWQ